MREHDALALVRFREDRDELVPAVAPHRVLAPHGGLQDLRDFDQQRASVQVAVTLIHELEIVQVDEAARQAQAVALRAADLPLELMPNRGVVQTSGQRVELGGGEDVFEQPRLGEAEGGQARVAFDDPQCLAGLASRSTGEERANGSGRFARRRVNCRGGCVGDRQTRACQRRVSVGGKRLQDRTLRSERATQEPIGQRSR